MNGSFCNSRDVLLYPVEIRRARTKSQHFPENPVWRILFGKTKPQLIEAKPSSTVRRWFWDPCHQTQLCACAYSQIVAFTETNLEISPIWQNFDEQHKSLLFSLTRNYQSLLDLTTHTLHSKPPFKTSDISTTGNFFSLFLFFQSRSKNGEKLLKISLK